VSAIVPEPVANLAIGAGASAAMAGISWLVQGVHYPMLRHAAGPSFPDVAEEHGRRIARIVAPLMLAELGTGIAVLAPPPRGVGRTWPGISLALLAGIWGSTGLVQARQHAALRRGFEPELLRALVRGNLPRTVAWTARAALQLELLRRIARNPGRPEQTRVTL